MHIRKVQFDSPFAKGPISPSSGVLFNHIQHSHISGLHYGGPLGKDESQMLAAFAKDHMNKAHSAHLSDLDTSQWGHIRKNAGT